MTAEMPRLRVALVTDRCHDCIASSAGLALLLTPRMMSDVMVECARHGLVVAYRKVWRCRDCAASSGRARACCDEKHDTLGCGSCCS